MGAEGASGSAIYNANLRVRKKVAIQVYHFSLLHGALVRMAFKCFDVSLSFSLTFLVLRHITLLGMLLQDLLPVGDEKLSGWYSILPARFESLSVIVFFDQDTKSFIVTQSARPSVSLLVKECQKVRNGSSVTPKDRFILSFISCLLGSLGT
jgi:hypothetical protein